MRTSAKAMIIDANKKLQAKIRRLETLYFVSVSLYAGEAKRAI
jgi:hypothetical protein